MEATRPYNPADKTTFQFCLHSFDQATTAIFAVDQRLELLYSNEPFGKLLRVSPSGLGCCESVTDLESECGIELVDSCRRVVAAGEHVQTGPFTFTTLSGNVHHLTIILTPLYREDSVTGVLGVINDCTNTTETTTKLEQKVNELKNLGEITEALHSSMKTEDILRMILVGVTCKEGLSFNRAFLFLRDSERSVLEGKVAIGPSNSEEAGRIWTNVGETKRPLVNVMAEYLANVEEYDVEVNRIVQSLVVDLIPETVFSRALHHGRWLHIKPGDDLSETEASVLRKLNTNECAVVPLISRGNAIGLIVADNLITGKRIEESEIHLLQIFADHATSAVVNSRLFAEIEQKATSLEQAYSKIERIQRQIAAMEKSSLLAEVTYKIAHELRNPLTIIGGFAALLKRNLEPADKLNEYAGIIAEETSRLEKALADVLNFSKSFAAEESLTDLNQILLLVGDVFEQQSGACGFSRRLIPSTQPLPVRVNRDQTVQSLYDVIDLMTQTMPKEMAIEVHALPTEKGSRVMISLLPGPNAEKGANQSLVASFWNRLTDSSLRLTLALETIRYNRGETGLAQGMNHDPYIYIDYPLPEEEDAAKNSLC